MPNIRQYDAGNLGLSPTEVGVSARAASARRIGSNYNELAGVTRELGHETSKVGSETARLGGETSKVGGETSRLGSETSKLGSETAALGQLQERTTADFGRRLGSGIAAAGEAAVKYLDHQQISAGASGLAGLIAGKTQQWNEIAKNADPNDPTVAQKFLSDNLEPDLAKFKEGFWTEGAQRWAENHVDQFRSHMVSKTSADMSTMAGHAAEINHRQSVNALSATVRSDPSSLDFSLRTLEESNAAVIGSSPNLTPAAAAKIHSELLQGGRESIIKSAALGYIEKTGQVPPWATDGKYAPYINGAELKQLAQAAKYYNRLNEAEGRADRATREHDARIDFHKATNELELSLIPQKVGDPVRLPDDYWDQVRTVGRLPGAALEPGRVQNLVRNGEAITARMNKPEPLGPQSHDTTMDLLRRMRATDESRLTDNGAIYDAYQKNKLNNADFNFLTREFQSLRSPEGIALEKDRGGFVKSYARLIDGMMNTSGVHSELGTQRMYEFEMDARRQENVLRQAGKDPHLVYDPRSEYFFGRPENVAKYRVSFQEAQAYEKTLKSMDKAAAEAPKPAAGPKVGDRKQFQEGWGVWNGKTYVPEKK